MPSLVAVDRDVIADRYIRSLPGLVLYLPLWKRDGGRFISDDAYGHLCSVTGALWGTQGRSFDGSDDGIDMGTPASLLPDAFTVETWIKFATFPSADYLIGWNSTQGQPALGITNNAGGRYTLYLGATCLHYFGPGDGTVVDTWHHITYTCPGSTQADADLSLVYHNGKPLSVYARTSGAQTAKNVTYVGRRATFNYWNGSIGEVLMYSRVLSQLEIQRHYELTRWRYQ